MTNKFVPVNIRPETRERLKEIKKECDVAHYRIIADGIELYARMHKSRGKIKFTMEEEK